MAAPAVCYAAKSTADERGSIPTQLADCRAAAEAEGRQVVGQYSDEAASAFRGNRGSGLTAAKDAAIASGAELWVQHSDRLARGDGITADHLAEVWFALRRHGVRLRSVQDDSNLDDAIRVVLIGERNHEDSKRKSAAVRSGLKRRRDERGEPVGAIPEGYRHEPTGEIWTSGRAVTRRVIDEQRSTLLERIFAMVETGHTFGDVARALNADGFLTRRGKQWTTRAIRKIVLNEDYTGSSGYPQLIDPERHARIVASLKRLDPVAVQARRGGRRPSETYLLRGIGFCSKCNQPLYTRSLAAGRFYICAAVREARGTCTAAKIPAEPVERGVIEHLHGFVGDVEQWITERAAEANTERDRFAETIDAQRAEMRKLQVRAERAREQYGKLLDAGDDLAPAALREAERMHRDVEGLQEALRAGQRRLESWEAPKVDAALDFYLELQDAIAGRIDGAKSVEDTAAALRTVLEGVHLGVTQEGKIAGQFLIRADRGLPKQHAWLIVDDELPSGWLTFWERRDLEDGSILFREMPVATMGRDEHQTLV
jgi:hypothetical protein